jgi:general transcription factor 3C polypeptide 5 (transcription factor C subunit 1)
MNTMRFPMQSPDTDHDNISRSYLQDLFGSFPFNGAGQDELGEANDSDGEYQIYEQYSDGNYSDDDEY